PATGGGHRQSVARAPHDLAVRGAAKEALTYPEVVFDGHQALSVANGFGEMTRISGYVIHACSILPCHVHMVIRRHHYPMAQVIRLLRQKATEHLLKDGRHPFADRRTPEGCLPSVWAQDSWKVFLFTEAEVLDRIAYVEQNPVKEGKRLQRWAFVTPYDLHAPVSLDVSSVVRALA